MKLGKKCCYNCSCFFLLIHLKTLDHAKQYQPMPNQSQLDLKQKKEMNCFVFIRCPFFSLFMKTKPNFFLVGDLNIYLLKQTCIYEKY